MGASLSALRPPGTGMFALGGRHSLLCEAERTPLYIPLYILRASECRSCSADIPNEARKRRCEQLFLFCSYSSSLLAKLRQFFAQSLTPCVNKMSPPRQASAAFSVRECRAEQQR